MDVIAQKFNRPKIEIEKWRINYEETYDYQREFFRITNIEDNKVRADEIENIMDSAYGKALEKLLKDNYKQN